MRSGEEISHGRFRYGFLGAISTIRGNRLEPTGGFTTD